MASRPRLKPYFRPLRRGPDAVQLGLGAGSGGVILRGLGPAEIGFLTGLDGTLTESELGRDAVARGVPVARAAALVDLLREHHLLDGDLDGAGPDRVDLGRLPGAPLAPAHLRVDDAPVLALSASGVLQSGVLDRSSGPDRPLRGLRGVPEVDGPPRPVGVARIRGGADGAEGPDVVHVVDEVHGADGFSEVGGSAGTEGGGPGGSLGGGMSEGQGGGPGGSPGGGLGGTRQLLQRTGWRVVVSGRGRLPWTIGSLLRTTGIGQVDLGPGAVHALDQALRADPSVDVPDLVVIVAAGVLDPHSGDPWWRRGVPTLPVVTDGRRIVVGPVVGDRTGPCLHCLDLERADRDAAWPALVAQVSGPGGLDPDDEVSTESTLTTMASGVVAMTVTAHLAGDRPPGGVSVEMSLPWPRLDHRRWRRHPRCAAHAATRHTGAGSGVAPSLGAC